MSDYFNVDLPTRHRNGKVWKALFRASTTVGIIVLVILLLTVINNAFGYVAYEFAVDPVSLAKNGITLEELSKDDLVLVLQENISKGLFRNLEHQVPFEQEPARMFSR